MKKPSPPRRQTLHSRLAARHHSFPPPPSEGWRLVVAGVVGTLLAIVFGWGIRSIPTIPSHPPEPPAQEILSQPVPAPLFRRALDGVQVSSPEEQNPPLIAMAIDNMVDARPVSGLEDALLVFEFPAEATITRFLPVFSARDVGRGSEIGPVRSARPYMADLAESIGAALAHSGGSPAALERFRKAPERSINEFSYSTFFWRDAKREPPHNLYTSIERMSRHPRVSALPSKLLPLAWQDEFSADLWDDNEKRITIGYPEPYTVSWRWDAGSRRFYRLNAVGAQESTRAGTAISADAVIVQFTDIRILDAVGRREIRLTGSGEALVFGGKGVELGFWKREKSSDRLAVGDANGEPIAVRPGRVWWTIVPNGTEVKFE